MANTSILAAFERMWHHVVAALGNKSDIGHTHDGYVTSNDFNELEDAINTSIEDIKNGDIVVKESEHATSADTATNATNAVNAQTANEATHAASANTATSATSATKATQDGNGKVISSTYETKTDASAKLSEAKQYADTTVSGKADSDHTHDDRYFTESEITTKLAGKSDTGHNHDTAYDAKGTAETKANAVQANLDAVSDELDDHVDNADIHVTAAKKTNWDKAYTHSQATHARTDATKVSDSTTNGNILINGTETNVYSHLSSGVTAGTYKSVTVNAQGHVTGGSNPTTLAGYGITDAESKGAANTALNSAKEYTDSEVSKKADSEHTHDGRYYTESEIDTKLSGKSDTSHNHNSSYDSKGTASSAVSTHNTATTAHSDIRDLITGLTTRLNTLADSDDTTLDQMSEVVAYIKSNKSLIEDITTNKVNVADIVNNLTTNVSNKPLSAAQGVAIKALIDALDDAIDGKADSSALTSHTGNTSNPHSVTKAQVGLGNVENKSSATIRGEITKANVTTALGYTPYTQTQVDDLLDAKSDDGHGHAIADVSGLQSALDGKAAYSHGTHVSFDSTNKPKMDGTAAFGTSSKVARADHVHPTDTTRAAQTSLDSHTGDTTVHVTSTERTNWNAAKTHADSAHAPSNAQVNVIESIKVNGTAQTITSKAVDITVPTKASDIGAASSSHGTHVTWSTTTPKANGTAAVGSETKVARGDHVHPTDTTRAAKTDFDSHTGDTTAHITSDERTNWNAAKTHADSTHARTDATKVEASSTNGKIKINGTETTVYTHPSGTNPHGTTKSDVGLGNVPNVATNDQTPTFTQASSRTNIASGEKLSVIFGKIMRWFADLKTVAFTGSYNDLSNKPTVLTGGSQTTTSSADGGSNVYTFTKSDGTTSTLTVKNGSKGDKGDKGDTGAAGTNGVTPTIKAASGSNIGTVGTPTVTASTSGTTTTFTFNNLKGAKGDKGDAGVNATTTSVATTSANGLMSSTDKTQHDNLYKRIAGYAVTAGTTSAYTATITGVTLTQGTMIALMFNASNAANATLNVNSLGAKPIYRKGAAVTASTCPANAVIVLVYDTTQVTTGAWHCVYSYDANTTYTNVKLGHGYVTCSTAEATVAKVGTLSSYTLTTGGIVAVKFTYAVPASATLNINSKGAKAIYHRGAAITSGVIKAGDLATFMYNGTQYHLLTVDRDENTKYEEEIAKKTQVQIITWEAND